MEDTLKTRDGRKPMLQGKRVALAILFTLAASTWLGWFFYMGNALLIPNLPVTWELFGAFLISVLLFLIPALILAFPSDPLSPRRVLISLWLIFVGVYWGFAPLYSYLTAHVSDRGSVLLFMLNYGWEVPVIGAIFISLIYRRFRRTVNSLQYARPNNRTEAQRIYFSLLYLPLFAAVVIFIFAVIGSMVGVLIAYLTIRAPRVELIKVVLSVTTLGFIAAILIFFILGRVLEPWLKKLPKVTGGRFF